VLKNKKKFLYFKDPKILNDSKKICKTVTKTIFNNFSKIQIKMKIKKQISKLKKTKIIKF